MTQSPDDLSDAELTQIERRAQEASPAPWESFIESRDHFAGSDFIRVGGIDDSQPDMYIRQYVGAGEEVRVPAADLDFIAHARQDVPRLVAEVRRLRRRLEGSTHPPR